MSKHHLILLYRQAFVAMAFAWLCGGCVAVNIGPGKPTKAESAKFEAPTSPFQEVPHASFDKAWKSKVTGNTIAFLSECKAGDDTSLKNLENESLSVLDNRQIKSTQDLDYNDRQAIRSSAQGLVDGVPVGMEILIFKKNDCTFTLSFVGRQSKLAADLPLFQSFLDRFKVP